MRVGCTPLHPEFDAILRNILLRDPQGVIVLIAVPYYNYTELLQSRFESDAEDYVDIALRLGCDKNYAMT
jgi:hypothetical protein